MIRTGRMTVWPDPPRYLNDSPGIGLAGARYLCEELGAMLVGADNLGLEVTPSDEPDGVWPVHSYMFATAGAQIMEIVWLEEIAAEHLHEFAFLGFPLRLRGATGSPMRPIAVPLNR